MFKIGICLRLGITAAGLILTACRSDYATVYSKRAPNGRSIASIMLYTEYWGGDQRLKFEVTSGGHMQTLYRDIGTDVYACFGEIYWTPDSRKVAVFANNCYARPVLACYDVEQQRVLGCEELKSGLRRIIAEKYHLPIRHDTGIGTDPLEWAATTAAREAFYQYHPKS